MGENNASLYKTEVSLIGIKDLIFEQSELDFNKFWIVPLIEKIPSDKDKEEKIYQVTGS